ISSVWVVGADASTETDTTTAPQYSPGRNIIRDETALNPIGVDQFSPLSGSPLQHPEQAFPTDSRHVNSARFLAAAPRPPLPRGEASGEVSAGVRYGDPGHLPRESAFIRA